MVMQYSCLMVGLSAVSVVINICAKGLASGVAYNKITPTLRRGYFIIVFFCFCIFWSILLTDCIESKSCIDRGNIFLFSFLSFVSLFFIFFESVMSILLRKRYSSFLSIDLLYAPSSFLTAL